MKKPHIDDRKPTRSAAIRGSAGRPLACRKARAVLAEFVFDELEPTRRALVQAHIEACPECARQVQTMTRTRELLAQAVAQSPAAVLAPARRAALLAAAREASRSAPSGPSITRRGWMLLPGGITARGLAATAAAVLIVGGLVTALLLPTVKDAGQGGFRLARQTTTSREELEEASPAHRSTSPPTHLGTKAARPRATPEVAFGEPGLRDRDSGAGRKVDKLSASKALRKPQTAAGSLPVLSKRTRELAVRDLPGPRSNKTEKVARNWTVESWKDGDEKPGPAALSRMSRKVAKAPAARFAPRKRGASKPPEKPADESTIFFAGRELSVSKQTGGQALARGAEAAGKALADRETASLGFGAADKLARNGSIKAWRVPRGNRRANAKSRLAIGLSPRPATSSAPLPASGVLGGKRPQGDRSDQLSLAAHNVPPAPARPPNPLPKPHAGEGRPGDSRVAGQASGDVRPLENLHEALTALGTTDARLPSVRREDSKQPDETSSEALAAAPAALLPNRGEGTTHGDARPPTSRPRSTALEGELPREPDSAPGPPGAPVAEEAAIRSNDALDAGQPLHRPSSGNKGRTRRSKGKLPSKADADSSAPMAAVNKAPVRRADEPIIHKTEPESLSDAAETKKSPHRPPQVRVNPFVLTTRDRLSTFALDTDTASYTRTRSSILSGRLPAPSEVRPEEFVNAFAYNYPRNRRATFTVDLAGAPSPFSRGLILLKVGVAARNVGREAMKPAHLVFAVDASGSMARPDRLGLIRYALKKLVGKLRPNDRISLVMYATGARTLLDSIPARQRAEIDRAVDAIQCRGSTNLLEGLEAAYALARKRFISGGVNRVILCSDGVANVGPDDAGALLARVAEYRRWGVTLTAVGVGAGAYNDNLLEQLADRGDGAYVFLDSKEEARRVFVEQLGGTLQVVARDAKVQVEFNPERVRRYRLIGYENRDIADKNFRNDSIDAGEVGSGRSATALYELELTEGRPGLAGAASDLGTVYVRCRNADTGRIEETSTRIRADAVRKRAVKDSPYFWLAAAVGRFAEVLRGSPYTSPADLPRIERIAAELSAALPLDPRVREFRELVTRARSLIAAK